MRVLIACEFSGVVRRAFRALGHDAYSCDLLPAEDGEQTFHIKWDVLDGVTDPVDKDGRPFKWDLLIAHPPCTRLTVAGARWFKGREQEQADAIAFCEALWAAEIPRICIENPIGVLSTRSKLGKPTQIIQPWQFGHGETKATCLWLKGLPKLVPTNIVEGRVARVHREPPGPDRWKNRSRTYEGIAQAMAEQWGGNAILQSMRAA
jgi:site-specific DNA-cytosine methylase